MSNLARLWLLLLLGLTVTAVIVQSQQQYYEDDEFDDFDDEQDMTHKHDSNVEQQQQQQQQEEEEDEPEKAQEDEVPHKMVMAEADDEDDAVVENEDADEFSHLSDEEEFIGYTSEGNSRSSHARKQSTKEPKITIANVPLHLRSNWDSFYLELVLLAGLLVYFSNFSVGRSKNARLATAWFEAHKVLLMQHFALVGDDGKTVSTENGTPPPTDKGSPPAPCSGLLKESENIYSLYCSGRVCVHSMMVELRFIKRQDLVSVVTQVFRPSTDEVVIRLRLDEMDTFVLCVAAKKVASKYIKEMTDITTYCPGDRKATLPTKQYGSGVHASKFSVWSETGEASTAVLGDQRTVAVLSKMLHRLNYLHISDQYSGTRQPDQDQQQQQSGTSTARMPEVHKMIILSFQLQADNSSTEEDAETLRPLMLLVLHLADKLYRLRLSKESKAKADRNRSRVEEAFLKATHAARAERAQEKREEKKRTEREKMMEIDDPEKQRKWEERENRRAAKRKGPKMKQMKVA